MANIILSYFQVGTIVNVSGPFEDHKGRAYVYENYDKPGLSGISIITEDGRDLGGYSLEEQAKYLQHAGDTGMVYVFKNVAQLAIDFERYIKPLFKLVK